MNSHPKNARGAVLFLAVLALPASFASRAAAGALYVGAAFSGVDTDLDGIADLTDNAPYISNISQQDDDGDFLGNPADPSPSDTDADNDTVIDFHDAQPTNPLITSIVYTLGGPYVVNIGQNLAVSFIASGPSYSGYDRLKISVDGVPNVATYLLAPGDTNLTLFGNDIANLGMTPGTHTLGVESFHNYVVTGSLETFTSITVIPEPTSAILGAAMLFARRRRQSSGTGSKMTPSPVRLRK